MSAQVATNGTHIEYVDEEGEEYEEVEEYEEIVEEYEEEYEEGEEYYEEGEEYEYEEEEVEDEEDPEDEAIMKYHTFPINSLKNGQDIMCMYAYERFIFLGTNEGIVHVLDAVEGNPVQSYAHHVNPIKDICADSCMDYFVSCCPNVIAVQNIFDTDDFFSKERNRPINAVAIHPDYKHQKDKPIVYGGADGTVVLNTKGRFLGNRSEHILQENRGKIHALRWQKNVIVWANDTSIVLCNYETKNVFNTYRRPESSPRPDLYSATLFFENDHTLLVGWAGWVAIIKIRQRALEERVRSGPDNFQYHLTSDLEGGFDTDRGYDPYMICGIAPFGAERLLLLTCTIEDGMHGHVKELETRIVQRVGGRNVYRGGLPVSDKSNRVAIYYSLANHPAETMAESVFFIVSLRSVIKATPCDDDDHIDHLLRQGQFIEAFDYAKTRGTLKRHQVSQIGETMLNFLVDQGRYTEAAQRFRDVLGNSNESSGDWGKWITLFDRRHQSEVLTEILPYSINGTVNGPHIKPEFYELVLNQCLESNVQLYKNSIRKFNGLYSHEALCNATRQRYKKSRTDKTVTECDMWILGETLGLLLEFQGKNSEALDVLMDVKNGTELFEFIKRHRLYTKAAEVLEKLFVKDKEQTINLLLFHERTDDEDELDPLNPDAVVKKLEVGFPDFLWDYLKALEKHDNTKYLAAARRQAQLFAELHADRDPDNLLKFLKLMSSSGLNIKKAYEMCKKRGFLEESVYLMSKMGHQEAGLAIIVRDMRHIGKAIEFIKEFPGDDDQTQLFRRLIELVMEADKQMKGTGGGKYFEHTPSGDRETWESIAKKYGIKESELRQFNKASAASSATLPTPVLVPMNMLSQLLSAVSDPSVSETTAIDPIYLIDQLPPDMNIPNIGKSLSRIAESKSRHKALMETQRRVLHGDLGDLQRQQQTRRSAAIRVNPRMKICGFCNDFCSGTNLVAFESGQVYHPKCVIDYLIEQGELKGLEKTIWFEIDTFFENPKEVLTKRSRKPIPYCYHAPPMETEDTNDVYW